MRKNKRTIAKSLGIVVAVTGFGVAASMNLPAFADDDAINGSCEIFMFENTDFTDVVFESRGFGDLRFGLGARDDDDDGGHGVSSSQTICGITLGVARSATIVLCSLTSSIDGDSVSAPRGVAARNCTNATTDANGSATVRVDVPYVGDASNDTAIAMAVQASFA